MIMYTHHLLDACHVLCAELSDISDYIGFVKLCCLLHHCHWHFIQPFCIPEYVMGRLTDFFNLRSNGYNREQGTEAIGHIVWNHNYRSYAALDASVIIVKLCAQVCKIDITSSEKPILTHCLFMFYHLYSAFLSQNFYIHGRRRHLPSIIKTACTALNHYAFSVFIPDTPEDTGTLFLREYIQASGYWPAPWEFHPRVVLTQLRTEVLLFCDGSSLNIGSNPILTGQFTLPPIKAIVALSADVAPRHSAVPEEWYSVFKVHVKSFGYYIYYCIRKSRSCRGYRTSIRVALAGLFLIKSTGQAG